MVSRHLTEQTTSIDVGCLMCITAWAKTKTSLKTLWVINRSEKRRPNWICVFLSQIICINNGMFGVKDLETLLKCHKLFNYFCGKLYCCMACNVTQERTSGTIYLCQKRNTYWKHYIYSYLCKFDISMLASIYLYDCHEWAYGIVYLPEICYGVNHNGAVLYLLLYPI